MVENTGEDNMIIRKLLVGVIAVICLGGGVIGCSQEDIDKAKETGQGAMEQTKEAGKEAMDKVKEAGKEAMDKAKEAGKDATDKTKEKTQ